MLLFYEKCNQVDIPEVPSFGARYPYDDQASGWQSTQVEVNPETVYGTAQSNHMFCSPDAATLNMPLPKTQMVADASRENINALHLREINEKRANSCRTVKTPSENSNPGEYCAARLPLTRYCQPPVSTTLPGVSEAALVRPSGPNHAVLRLDDLLFNFDVDSETHPLKQKRETFSAEGHKKVHEARKTHACVSCRSRKISVSPSLLNQYGFLLIYGSALRVEFASIAAELLMIHSRPSKFACEPNCKMNS
jgi:hypothetical protein